MPSESLAAQIAVAVHDVRKKYRLFSSPAERLKEAFHPLRQQFHREFWALNGVTFDLAKGETLGILGANGSGKSTLLQVIAGILQPTSGSLKVNGRVAALLELGAGFNPEFTGRDNVILNGAINGIASGEMAKRLPEIEAFADIGNFFDQPVKTYSNGMFVRVAFATAINVDADILVIDEVLAVGDARFQNKCYEMLARFQKEGKSIVMVTHDAAAVANHCDRALVMDRGCNIFDGVPAAAIDCYYELLYPRGTGVRRRRETEPIQERGASNFADTNPAVERTAFWNPEVQDDRCRLQVSYNPNETRFGNGSAEIIDYVLLSDQTHDGNRFSPSCNLRLLVKVLPKRSLDEFVVGFAIKSVDGVEIYGTNTGSALLNRSVPVKGGSVCFFEFSFEQMFAPGDYFIDIGLAEDDGTPAGSVIEVRRSVCHFTITPNERTPFQGIVDLKARFVQYSDRDGLVY